MSAPKDQSSSWLRRHLGVVRLRQIADRIRHRLSFVPMLYVGGAIVLVQALLVFDRTLNDQALPGWLETTVDSARSVFTAMAGGLITSITLLLSMMLVAVQLASTQFSPRTLRDWLGNRTLQHAIGLVLGTTVFCLLALRSTRDLGDDGDGIVPHVTVLVAVALGVLSLVAVVRSVDHLTQSVRVGSVADRVAAETIDVVDRVDDTVPSGQAPEVLPGTHPDLRGLVDVPTGAAAVEAPVAGWIQQMDTEALLDAIPDGSSAFVAVSIGGFVPAGAPLVWIDPPPSDDHPARSHALEAFALGDSRTMQQDVEFGLVQLTDIAVRALSPGVNDPTTACDVIVHIGDVLISIWARQEPSTTRTRDGRTVVLMRTQHVAYLDRALGPIRRYGRTDPEVMTTLLRTITLVRSETLRRGLPGPIEPLDTAIADTTSAADTTGWSRNEIVQFESVVGSRPIVK
ncbi:MAG TPA: DUF2254 domain-containing protein [Ilumatobacteraceae bacterium]|nr:DUF2254 domain-containing protein [Ilumatobacteraceae bacterium]